MNTVKGIKYYLADDCDTLVCKLQNKLDDLYMDSNSQESELDKLENDLEILQSAINVRNVAVMQACLNRYSCWFKRYR